MKIPTWIITGAGWSLALATIIIFSSILCHLLNYRKPFHQRLMIRIQLIVPLFALLCFAMLVDPQAVFIKFAIEPLREIYEAFVIYTFFSLLTDMLGGERNIIIMTLGRQPVSHPGFMGLLFPPLDISDPSTFLGIKRGILQYVWLKPVICFSMLFAELLGWYDVNNMGPSSMFLWLTVIYNFSVTLSLYCLAIFWKILWTDLKPFKPVGKFLCVKLIIFASYWQGILLALLNFFGVLPGSSQEEGGPPNIGISIQNGLLCFELIFFAIGHWYSFSYRPFTLRNIPNGRLQFRYALKDILGVKDLLLDFRLTFYGDYYKDYKQFDSVDATIAHPDSKGRMSRINQGLRYHSNGKHKHWLPTNSLTANNGAVRSTSEINAVSPTLGPSSTFKPNYSSSLKSHAPSIETSKVPSIRSVGTSTRAIYSALPKNLPQSLPEPTEIGDSITEVLNSASNHEILYDNEYLDEDEAFYESAYSVINNYKLDQVEVKRMLNYPIVDELIDGHVFGYKVKKLRADRLRSQESERLRRASSQSSKYGSVV